MNSLMQDFRYALRQLRKTPGFTLTAVTVLALGIGANIAMFTVLNGILLRPLPYAQPDRIVKADLSMNYASILQLRDAVGPKIRIGARMFGGGMASVVGPGGRFQVDEVPVTAGLPAMLGVQPMLGRTFSEEEDAPGRSHVALLGEDTWRKLYNSDPHAVGKTLTLRGEAYTILGVMPKGFSFPFGEEMELWSPAAQDAASRSAMSGGQWVFGELYARLPDGMTPVQLATDLSRALAVIAKQNPWAGLPSRVEVTVYQQSVNHDAAKPLALLDAVVIAIWALACLNVTSLMLTRAVARNRELAVRTALGASRARLLQLTIVESLLLSGIGSVLGLLLGQSAMKLFLHQISRNSLMTSLLVHLDWRVVLCLVALTLFTAVIVGVFPALRAMRRNVHGSLHGVTATASGSQNRTREALVVAQLALTLVFLAGAGLFLRTIHALRQVPLGFTQQNVLVGGIVFNPGSIHRDQNAVNKQTDIVRTAYLPLLDRLRAIPGVKVAALSSSLPLRELGSFPLQIKLDHKDFKGPSFAQSPQADVRLVTQGLVDALGIPMMRGRFFTDDDTPSSPLVVVVNQAFASHYFPGQDPIGHVISMGKGRFDDAHIVGVIGDVKQSQVTDATKPEVNYCLAQIEPGTTFYGIATGSIQVAIRGAVPADSLRTAFDKALHEVSADATTMDVKTIHEIVEDSFRGQILTAHFLGCFAGLALLIASVGLYGSLSFAVAQRTREIGVRLALGAPQANILSLILRHALLLVCIGLSIGGVLAWFAVRLASGYIYGVQAHDALTFSAVVLVLAAASFIAAWLPARRAAAVDPMTVLRSE